MRVLLVGNSVETAALAKELEAGGLVLESWPEDEPASGGAEEVSAIARELRELERALGADGPEAVLVASDSSAALAAVLVATKLGTPVGRVEGLGSDSSGANERLIRQLADAAVAPEAASIVEWLRGTYTPRA